MNIVRSAGGIGALIGVLLTAIVAIGQGPLSHAATDTDPWVFVSSPDWFNTDIADLSGSTPGIPAAPGWDLDVSGGVNGISPQMQAVYSQLAGEMATYGPEAFLVAGDLVNGYWFTTATLDMFAPDTRDRTDAINTAAEIYYGWYRKLFEEHGIPLVIAAPGDHELGDDAWPAGSDKSLHVETMKRAFVREIVEYLDPPDPFPGVPATPPSSDGYCASFAYRVNNVLFVSVDEFDELAAGEPADPWIGTLRLRVDGHHLAWLAQVLAAADADPSIDHVVVQGHAPVIDPVRMRTTSGLMVAGREDSQLWQLLRQHDLRRGGKVRLYFAGEVHAPTVTRDPAGDVVQIVHGNPPRITGPDSVGNYVVFTVYPERISAELRRFDLYTDDTSLFWQPGTFSGVLVNSGPGATSGGRSEGRLTLDVSGGESSLTGEGWLTPVSFRALTVHYGFDARTADQDFSNTGEFGDLFFTGVPIAGARSAPGILGEALALDGAGDFVDSGRGHLIEGETRTVAAWVKLTAGDTNTILSYGARRTGVNGRFLFRLVNGRPEVDIAPGIVCRPVSAPAVNDGRWHHVAVVLTENHDNRCADLRFYVDGEACGNPTGQATLRTLPWADLRIGVDERATGGFFDGLIDDIAYWHAPLTAGQVRSLQQAALYEGLQYDARQIDALIDLYESRGEPRMVADREWRYAEGLHGAAGDVAGAGDHFTIQFDSVGGGVETGVQSSDDAYVRGGVEAAEGVAVLTAEGSADWLHAGLSSATSINRKASGLAQIGPLETVGLAPRRYNASNRPACEWTDGSPTGAAYTRAGLYLPGVGRGFRITLPADRTPRRAVAYLGGYKAEGLLHATLSDPDGPEWSATLREFDGAFDRRVVIDYQADAESAVLTLTYVMTAGAGNVTFQAVTLQGAAANQAPEIEPIPPRTIEVGQHLALAVRATDPDGPPPLVLEAVGVPIGAVFTDLHEGTGVLEWTPSSDDASAIPYPVHFTARDGQDLTATTTALITVISPVGSVLDVEAFVADAMTQDLTMLGEADWKHFGLTTATSVNRKAGVPDQIGTYTLLGDGSVRRYDAWITRRQSAAWSDGTPVAARAATATGLYVPGKGAGFTLSLPAGVTEQTAHLLVGGWRSSALLEVELSDGSAPASSVRFEDLERAYDRLVVVRYRAAADGQALRIRYVAESVASGGNVTLAAVTLAGAPDVQTDDGVVDVEAFVADAMTQDLTMLGEADWKHFGLTTATSVNRKAGVPDQIGTYTLLGDGSVRRYDARITHRQSAAWSDGTPVAARAATATGLYVPGKGAGFTLSLPAGVTEQTAHLLVGGWQSSALLEVELSDGSAPASSVRFEDLERAYDRLVVVRYRAAADGQALRIRYVAESTTGNVTLAAVTLADGTAP